jgi:hypothetical protein
MKSSLRRISFHDPDGSIFLTDSRILRNVSLNSGARLNRFICSQVGLELLAERFIPATREVPYSELLDLGISQDVNSMWFEHNAINFVSYPHEWVPEMLISAAELTLNLAMRLQAGGFDLKDASANNVLFEGTSPIFVDLCSIVERQKVQPYWLPKGQFERHFILPLIAYIERSIPPDRIHFSYVDGLDPAILYNLLGIKKWTSFLALKHSTLPVMLSGSKKMNEAKDKMMFDSDVCIASQDLQMRSLKQSLARIKKSLPIAKSNWGEYIFQRCHYSSDTSKNKFSIVQGWLLNYSPKVVLDLGSNTGEYSRLAAECGARVISLEADLACARIAFVEANRIEVDSQVVLQDLGSPSPPMGWRGAEKLSLSKRISENIDCILALAILHHLLVSSAIPLAEIISQLADWTSDYLVIEYIPPKDSMFLKIAKHRGVDFTWLTCDLFKMSLTEHFEILNEEQLYQSDRTLFYCRKI